MPDDVPMPAVPAFFEMVKHHTPEVCILDVWEIRPKKHCVVPDMTTMTPSNKIDIFLSCHQCYGINECTEECLAELELYMEYSAEEIAAIDKATQGQSLNQNWHDMRRGILTASKYRTICHSTNGTKTAIALLNGPSWDKDKPPQHIEFGQRYESKARDEFFKAHRFHHRGCHISVPGLRLNNAHPFLGASPDGILVCKHCPSREALIEIKCLSSKKNYQPGSALTLLKICTREADSSLVMNKDHAYYYQIQGQMFVTGIHVCFLVAYTHKGTSFVRMPFDEDFCEHMISELTDFYKKSFFPLLRAVGHA